MNKWMPINTAPLDGSIVLVCHCDRPTYAPEAAFFGHYHQNSANKPCWRSDLKTARNFDRAYYRLRVQELRKKIYELTKAKTEVKEDFPKKWCIKITKKNRDLLNKYLSDNRSKYGGWIPNWAVSLCSMYFFSESVHKYSHSSIDTLPGFVIIKNKSLKHYI